MIKSLAWSSNVLDGVKSSFVAMIRFFLRNADILAKQHCQVPIKTLIFDRGKKRKVRAISLHNCLRFPIYTLQQLKGHAGSLFRIDVCRISFAAFLGICRSARLLRDLLVNYEYRTVAHSMDNKAPIPLTFMNGDQGY